MTATYQGDSNYAGSSGATSESVTEAPAITSPDSTTFYKESAGSFTVTATGLPEPGIAESGTLPTGVRFDPSTDTLSGTPMQTGTYPISFTATNEAGFSTQSFTLTVIGLHVTSTSLPDATPATRYIQQLEAAGGMSPYKWKVTGGSLPKGLRLTSKGVLRGQIHRTSYPSGGSFSFTVTVTDKTKKVHQTATATLTVTVSPYEPASRRSSRRPR